MPSTILTEVKGWTPLIDHMVETFGITTAAVYGRMWRYCQLRDGVCSRSVINLAADLGLARSTVRLAIKRLVNAGYLRDLTPDNLDRPHIYQDTGKANISASIEATTGDPLRKSEASDIQRPPLRKSEATPSENQRPPLRSSEAPPPKIGGKRKYLRKKEDTFLREVEESSASAPGQPEPSPSLPATTFFDQNLSAMSEFGIADNDLSRYLAKQEWVNPDYIRGHAKRLNRKGKLNPGLLLRVIQAADPLDPQDKPRDFVSGEFAEFINH